MSLTVPPQKRIVAVQLFAGVRGNMALAALAGYVLNDTASVYALGGDKTGMYYLPDGIRNIRKSVFFASSAEFVVKDCSGPINLQK